MGYVFALQYTPAVDVACTIDHSPIHRIFYVGQNYAKHVREMGANPEREARFFQQVRICSLH